MQPQPAQLEADAMRQEIARLREKIAAIEAHRDAVRLLFMKLHSVLDELQKEPQDTEAARRDGDG